GAQVASAKAQQYVGFTATGATFTYPVLFGSTAGTLMGFQESIDLGAATAPYILDPSVGTHTVADTHTYVSGGQFTIAGGEISEDLFSFTATADSKYSGRTGGRG